MAKTASQIRRRAKTRGQALTPKQVQSRMQQSRRDAVNTAPSRPQPSAPTRRLARPKAAAASSGGLPAHKPITTGSYRFLEYGDMTKAGRTIATEIITGVNSSIGVHKRIHVTRNYTINSVTSATGERSMEIGFLGDTSTKIGLGDTIMISPASFQYKADAKDTDTQACFLRFGLNKSLQTNRWMTPFYQSTCTATDKDVVGNWGHFRMSGFGLPPYAQQGERVYGKPLFRVVGFMVKSPSTTFTLLDTLQEAIKKAGDVQFDFSHGARVYNNSVVGLSGARTAGDLATAHDGQDWRLLVTPQCPQMASGSVKTTLSFTYVLDVSYGEAVSEYPSDIPVILPTTVSLPQIRKAPQISLLQRANPQCLHDPPDWYNPDPIEEEEDELVWEYAQQQEQDCKLKDLENALADSSDTELPSLFPMKFKDRMLTEGSVRRAMREIQEPEDAFIVLSGGKPSKEGSVVYRLITLNGGLPTFNNKYAYVERHFMSGKLCSTSSRYRGRRIYEFASLGLEAGDVIELREITPPTPPHPVIEEEDELPLIVTAFTASTITAGVMGTLTISGATAYYINTLRQKLNGKTAYQTSQDAKHKKDDEVGNKEEVELLIKPAEGPAVLSPVKRSQTAKMNSNASECVGDLRMTSTIGNPIHAPEEFSKEVKQDGVKEDNEKSSSSKDETINRVQEDANLTSEATGLAGGAGMVGQAAGCTAMGLVAIVGTAVAVVAGATAFAIGWWLQSARKNHHTDPPIPRNSNSKQTEVLSIDPHPEKKPGEFFTFDKQELSNQIGRQPHDGEVFHVLTNRSGYRHVKIWTDGSGGGTRGDCNGRCHPEPSEGDWQVGDKIHIQSADEYARTQQKIERVRTHVSMVGNVVYFNYQPITNAEAAMAAYAFGTGQRPYGMLEW